MHHSTPIAAHRLYLKSSLSSHCLASFNQRKQVCPVQFETPDLSRSNFDSRHGHPLQQSKKSGSRPISRVLSKPWTEVRSRGNHSSRRVVADALQQPTRKARGPRVGRVTCVIRPPSLFGLAPGGVCRAGLLPSSRCALTAPFHPCLIRQVFRLNGHRRCLSVALSVGLRRPAINWRPALRSPDFPPPSPDYSSMAAIAWPTPAPIVCPDVRL